MIYFPKADLFQTLKRAFTSKIYITTTTSEKWFLVTAVQCFLFHSIFYCFQSNSHGYYLNNIWFYFIMIHTCKCFDDRGTWINVFYHYIQIFSWTQKVCNKCLLIDFTGQLRKVVDWKLRNMSSWPLLKKFNDSWHVSLLP